MFINFFLEEPTVVRVASPVVIVGDLHGHVLDLIRILQYSGHPPKTKYLFLGDTIDRGEFSLETIILILLFKIVYPNDITLIRGNHEFSQLCNHSGFGEEVRATYYEPLALSNFFTVFSVIPLAAVIDDSTLCIHGGIGPDIHSLQDIEKISRPIFDLITEFII